MKKKGTYDALAELTKQKRSAYNALADTVDHTKHLDNLENWGTALGLILSSRTQTVRVLDRKSYDPPLKTGVTQITMFRPLLLTIYINDPPHIVPGNEILSHASHTVMISTGET